MGLQRPDAGRDLRRGRRLAAFVASCAALACASSPAPPPVVGDFDVERYLGRWYEIASFPQVYQRGCVATTARYSRREDGRIRVVNECHDGAFDGELRRIEGVAWAPDPEASPAKLEVQFFWPFTGAYWILALDRDYRWAVVGHPDRESLWILSRTPTLDETTLTELRRRAAAVGFDAERLVRTPQPPAAAPES